jgi:para-nitrobenzyl esterase
MNYRLGVLGYMAHPALTSESGGKASGNYGLLDQIAALQWIQQNIAAFGGDPQVVTIAGQSAGASSVHALTASPLAKGLFHRAIAESGSSVAAADPPSLADAEQMGVRLATAVNAQSIADLRAVPWATLAERSGRNSPFRFGIIVDGSALREPPARTFASGSHNDVPFLTGTNGDENGAVPNPMMQAAGWAPYAKQRYGAMADAFLALYPVATDADAATAQNASARDQARTSTHLWALNRQATSRSRIFTYFFTHPLPGPDSARYGAFHTSEVPYVFNTLNGPGRSYAEADRALAETISSYWANFARTGDPNGAGLPEWPAVSAAQALTMELGDMVRPIPVAEKSRLEFFKRFFARPIE